MDNLILILVSTFLISLISFLGILTLLLKEKILDRVLLYLVSLSAGTLMGGAFLHLIPEAIELSGTNTFIYVLFGFAIFYFIEKLFHWRHCHEGKCEVHTFAYMNLFGEAIHNFLDGLIIAAGFITNINLGIATTLAIAFHEIPQEISDIGVLIYGGFDKFKALLLNFLIAITAIGGGIGGYFLFSYINSLNLFLLPFAAGGFIYVSASDLIPELRKTAELKKSFINFSVFIIGILLMYYMSV